MRLNAHDGRDFVIVGHNVVAVGWDWYIAVCGIVMVGCDWRRKGIIGRNFVVVSSY